MRLFVGGLTLSPESSASPVRGTGPGVDLRYARADRIMRLPLVPLGSLLVVAACSSSGGDTTSKGPTGDGGSDGGGADDAATLPDAFIAATIGKGAASSTCSMATPQSWLSVGEPTLGKPATVLAGDKQAGNLVSVQCMVLPAGNGFAVSLSIVEAGASGGSVTINSSGGEGPVTSSGGQGITGKFENASGVVYEGSNDCTIAFTYLGQPVPDAPPVAAGRIWGHISCPSAVNSADGDTCDAEADFLFEECQQ